MRRPLLLAAVVAALAACAGPSTPIAGPAATAPPTAVATAAPVPSRTASVTAAPSPVVAPAWAVGASPLPLRPDGFGQVLPTPPELRDRRLTAASTLPPPADGTFHATVGRVSPAIRTRMGQTWSAACPVGLGELRYLTVSFRGFDDRPHTGELVVNAAVADDVVQVFRTLYAARFPIEEMRLPTTADLDAAPTGDGNNTASYVCRAARGQTRWSQHAYGLAIDVNPFQNPDLKKDLVLPELATAYTRRGDVRPGMLLRGQAGVRAFAAIGWEWGGDWHSSKDWMHFSRNGQ